MFKMFVKKARFLRLILSIVLAGLVCSSMPIKGYAGLGTSDKLRAKAADGNQRMLEMQQELIQKIIVNVNDIRNDELGKSIAGGKGANLGELSHVAGIKVPTALALTTKAFRMHIDKGKVTVKNSYIIKKIENRLNGLKSIE